MGGCRLWGRSRGRVRPTNAICSCPSVSMGCVYYIWVGVDGGARILYSIAGISSWDLLLESWKIVVGHKGSEIPFGLLLELKGIRLVI